MKKFNIEVISKKPEKIAGELCHWGQITIGDYKEKFIMSLDSWGIDKYKKQWQEGIERIKTHDMSCLIADISTLETNPLMNYWVLYRVGKTIFIQNQILGGELFEESKVGLPAYNAETCYLYLLPRKTTNESGYKVDEWEISVDDFFASLEK